MPDNIGMKGGTQVWTEATLTLTKRITIPYIHFIDQNKLVLLGSYSINELTQEHLEDARGFFLCNGVIAGEPREPFQHLNNDEVEDHDKDSSALDDGC